MDEWMRSQAVLQFVLIAQASVQPDTTIQISDLTLFLPLREASKFACVSLMSCQDQTKPLWHSPRRGEDKSQKLDGPDLADK